MNCTTCQANLSAYLDRELEPEARAHTDEHLAGCFDCRAELEELSALASKLRTSFAELRGDAPAPPSPPAEKMPLGSRLAAAAAVLILGTLTWRSFQGALEPNHLTKGETTRLAAAGRSALTELANSGEFRVDIASGASPRSFHFAKGTGGAYLWQPTLSAGERTPSFDPSRYLAGSDGTELWVSAPRAQKLPLDAARPPLPRRLALGLEALTELAPSDAPNLSSDPAEPDTVWLRARAETTEGPITAWVQLDRELATPLAFRIEVEPGESLDIAALETTSEYDFHLSPTLQPDLTAIQEPLDPMPLSDALWQLGYTPGAVLPPEALEGLAPEGSGYL